MMNDVVVLAGAIEIASTVGVVLGVVAACIIPFILYALAKRSKDWDELRKQVEVLSRDAISTQGKCEANFDKIEAAFRRLHETADKSAVEQLRTSIEQLKDNERDLHKEYVTKEQYQRDIDAFEKIVQLLRDTIQQQTDMLERLRK